MGQVLPFQRRPKTIEPVAVPPAPVWPQQPTVATPADWIGLNVAACAIAAAAVVMFGLAVAMPWIAVPRQASDRVPPAAHGGHAG